MADNAFVQVNRVDQSITAANALNTGMTVAAAIFGDRGFINQPVFCTNSNDRQNAFGIKNARQHGVSQHSMDYYLASGSPAWIVRAGDSTTWLNAGASLAFPTVITNWSASPGTYAANAIVVYNGLAYIASASATGTDIPGTAAKWVPVDSGFYMSSSGAATPAFSAALTYAVGASVLQAGVYYKCITAVTVPGAFSGAQWIAEPLQITTAGITYANIDALFTANQGVLNIVARGEGPWGNSIQVQGTPVTTAYDSVTQTPPAWNVNAIASRLSDITVTYNSTIVETFRVSSRPGDEDATGASFYVEDVINTQSQYIRVGHSLNNPTMLSSPLSQLNSLPLVFPLTTLTGGVGLSSTLTSASSPTRAIAALNALNTILQNPDVYNINFVMNAGAEIDFLSFSGAVVTHGGSVGFSGVALADSSLGATALAALRTSTYLGSYWQVALDSPSFAVPEIETGVSVWLTAEAARAYCYGVAAANNQLFLAIAGYQRGVIPGVQKLNIVYKPSERAQLAGVAGVGGVQINPIRSDKDGTVLGDTLTTQTFSSAYSNIPTAITFFAIKSAILSVYKGFLFEFNDVTTVNSLEKLLTQIGNQLVRLSAINSGFTVGHPNNVFGSQTIQIQISYSVPGITKAILVNVIATPSSVDVQA